MYEVLERCMMNILRSVMSMAYELIVEKCRCGHGFILFCVSSRDPWSRCVVGGIPSAGSESQKKYLVWESVVSPQNLMGSV